MKPGSDPKSIAYLNRILKNELTAINQYFLHSRMLANWGISELSKKEYEESIDEMKHSDSLVQRILFLGGLPNLQDLDKLLIGDEQAFRELVGRYHTSLVRIARYHVDSEAAAQDVAQDTWVAVLRGVHKFEGRSSFKLSLIHI